MVATIYGLLLGIYNMEYVKIKFRFGKNPIDYPSIHDSDSNWDLNRQFKDNGLFNLFYTLKREIENGI